MALATADGDDLVRVVQIDTFDGHRVAEDLRREGAGQVLLGHTQKTDALFRFAVRIDDGFLDQRLNLRFTQASSSGHGSHDGYAGALGSPKVSAQAFGVS